MMNNEIDTRGILYIVATPIGNREDITLRALSILKEVDVILCEDTRTTGVLLKMHSITNTLMSYNAHATEKKHDSIIAMLKEGKKIALVSDAGTPTISDPGIMLVQEALTQLGDDVVIVPIPGASALITALSGSGISTASFTFLGFLPHKKGRQTLFKEIAGRTRPYVFYESPHRLLKTLQSLDEYVGEQGIVVARELTKIHETFHKGTPKELLDSFEKNPQTLRGECVVIVP